MCTNSMRAAEKRAPMHFIATRHLAWVRAHLRGDSSAQVFIEARERPFAILWDDSSITIKYEDVEIQYYLQYLESGLETWDAWTSGREKFCDAITFNMTLCLFNADVPKQNTCTMCFQFH